MLGTHLMAMLARMTRSSLLEVLGEDYVRTARAKGLGATRVIVKHALRNAIAPVITVAGMQFGSLLAGAVVTEKVFARPGIGTLLLDGISQRDYRVVQGCTLVTAACYVLVNLLVDLAYAQTDRGFVSNERARPPTFLDEKVGTRPAAGRIYRRRVCAPGAGRSLPGALFAHRATS